jgi:hypothetical protein
LTGQILTIREFCESINLPYQRDPWQYKFHEKKLAVINLPLYLREILDKRARGESKTFDTMELGQYLSHIGFVGIWFGAAKDQIEQPKKYMKWIIENSFLKYMVADLLKESVIYQNGGSLKLKNLTEMNARSSRADFIIYDEEAKADQDAYNAAVNILAGSPLGLIIHISTPEKGSPFEVNYERLRRREVIHGEQFIFSRTWKDASWLRSKADWYEEQKKILPDWYFRQEHEAEFTHAMGSVFRNVVYDVYQLINNRWELKHDLVIHPKMVSGLDWNPVSGHWIVGGHWVNDMKGFLITHAIPIAVGYTHELMEDAYEKIKFYAIHNRSLNMESGGINEGYGKWFKGWFYKDKAKRDVSVRYEEWDSSGINKMNAVLSMLDKTIYVDEIRFPELAAQIKDCAWDTEADKPRVKKDPVDSPHALDAFLHAVNMSLLKDQGLMRFDWYGSTE